MHTGRIPFTSRLSFRYGAILLLFSALPLIIVAVLLSAVLARSFEGEIFFNRQEIIKGYSRDIQSILKTPIDILETFTDMITPLYRDREKLTLSFYELTLEHKIYSHLALYNKDGNMQVHSGLVDESGGNLPFRRLKEGIRESFKGDTFVSELYLGDGNLPCVEVYVPVKEKEVVYVLCSIIDLSRIWQVVDSISIGQTGKAFMASSDRCLIAHWDKKRILKGELIDEAYQKGVRYAEEKGVSYFLKEQTGGEPAKVVYFSRVKLMGWFFFIEQNYNEVFYFYRVSKFVTLTAIAVTIMGALWLSIFVGRRVARPITELSGFVDKVSRRNYDVHIEEEREDEIGTLIDSFNVMTVRLKKAEEQEQLAIFGATAANIAHKLKNAFVSIKTYVQLFQRRKDNAAFVDEVSLRMVKDISKIEQMLSRFSKLKASDENSYKLFDLRELVRELKYEFGDRFDDVDISFDELKSSVFIEGVRDDLKEVFTNLINNAAEAMEYKGSICFLVKEEADFVCIDVHDTGKGFTQEEREKAFDFFQTTKPYGMGIGLAYCKKVLSGHNGSIEIKSSPGKGSCISLNIPKQHKSAQI